MHIYTSHIDFWKYQCTCSRKYAVKCSMMCTPGIEVYYWVKCSSTLAPWVAFVRGILNKVKSSGRGCVFLTFCCVLFGVCLWVGSEMWTWKREAGKGEKAEEWLREAVFIWGIYEAIYMISSVWRRMEAGEAKWAAEAGILCAWCIRECAPAFSKHCVFQVCLLWLFQ